MVLLEWLIYSHEMTAYSKEGCLFAVSLYVCPEYSSGSVGQGVGPSPKMGA